jgi:hypothetical protein
LKKICLVALVIVSAFISTPVFARNKHDWERVKKLRPGAPVYVTLSKGMPISGRVVVAEEHEITLATRYPWDNGIPEKIDRENVERIVLVKQRHLPDGGKVLVGATLLGGAVGATAGAVNHAHGDDGRWIVDGLGGAGVGFFLGCVVDVGVGVAAFFQHDKLVYESNRNGFSSSRGRSRANRPGANGVGANLLEANVKDGTRNPQIEDPR